MTTVQELPLKPRDVRYDVISLDDFPAERNIDPAKLDFIRMDILGYEAVLLPTMVDALRKGRAVRVLIELYSRFIDARFDWIQAASDLGEKQLRDDVLPQEVLDHPAPPEAICFESWLTIPAGDR